MISNRTDACGDYDTDFCTSYIVYGIYVWYTYEYKYDNKEKNYHKIVAYNVITNEKHTIASYMNEPIWIFQKEDDKLLFTILDRYISR